MAGTSRIPRSLCAAAVAALLSGAALAQTPAPAAPAPEFTFTGNLGLYSLVRLPRPDADQSEAGVQGGFDLGHKSGFYAGTWGVETFSVIDDAVVPARPPSRQTWSGTSTAVTRADLPADFGYDLGRTSTTGIRQLRTKRRPATSSHTTPCSTPRSPGILSLHSTAYSCHTTRRSATATRRGSSYLDLTASYDVVEKGPTDAIGRSRSRTSATSGTPATPQRLRQRQPGLWRDWKVGASTDDLTASRWASTARAPTRSSSTTPTSTARTSRRTSSSLTSRRPSDRASAPVGKRIREEPNEIRHAIIKPSSSTRSAEALSAIRRCRAITVTEVKGFARQNRHTDCTGAPSTCVDFLPKLKIEAAMQARHLDQGDPRTIRNSRANTGKIGVRQDLRLRSRTGRGGIRTGETGRRRAVMEHP